MSVRRELASGVFYTSIAKYAGIVVTLVVTGILSRLFTPEQFGVVNIATVVIAFFAIFSDLGIGPAVIQHKDLDRHDLGSGRRPNFIGRQHLTFDKGGKCGGAGRGDGCAFEKVVEMERVDATGGASKARMP